MALPEPSFRDIDRMMHHLETAIDNNTATPQLLAAMQKRLDVIDKLYKDDPSVASQYHKLLEVQALIYGTKHNDTEAKKFIAGATQLAGSSAKLSSRLLRAYIKDHPVGGPAGQDMHFFSMSLTRLVMLSIFTVGLYELYWFYKNWQLIKQAAPQKMWPFWRAVFSIFWAWPLFKTVLAAAKQQGYDRSYSPGFLAFLYALLAIIANSLNRMQGYNLGAAIAAVIVLVLGVLPLLAVQKAINFNNTQLKTKHFKRTAGENTLIVIGVILFVLSMVAWFVPMDKAVSALYPSEQRTRIKHQQAEMESLTQQYNTCSSELKVRAPKVDPADPEAVDTYNSDLAACDAIRVKQNTAVDTYNELIEQPS